MPETDRRSGIKKQTSLVLPEMDLPTAREILGVVKSTPENTLSGIESFNRVGPYSGEQIGRAVKAVITDLIGRYERCSLLGTVGKVSGINVLEISTSPTVASLVDGKQEDGFAVLDLNSQYLSALDGRIVAMRYPLITNLEVADAELVSFIDRERIVTFLGLQRRFNQKDFEFLFRGLRWMSANLLAWEAEGIILPEDLDKS